MPVLWISIWKIHKQVKHFPSINLYKCIELFDKTRIGKQLGLGVGYGAVLNWLDLKTHQAELCWMTYCAKYQ